MKHASQPARGSELQKRAARLSIVMEDPQTRRPRFHAPRASLAFAEAWHHVCANTHRYSLYAAACILFWAMDHPAILLCHNIVSRTLCTSHGSTGACTA